jgi:hypothetical protein
MNPAIRPTGSIFELPEFPVSFEDGQFPQWDEGTQSFVPVEAVGGGGLDYLEESLLTGTAYFGNKKPDAQSSSITGIPMEIYGGDAVAGTSVDSSADGNSLTVRAGNAAQRGTGGNANGGHLILQSGEKVGGFSAGYIFFKTGNVHSWAINSQKNFLEASGSGGAAQINYGISSSTQPVYSFISDTQTGIGRAEAGAVSIITQAVEAGRFDKDSTPSNTRFLLYDVDTATLKRVSVGANDSAGSGFKLLRVTN